MTTAHPGKQSGIRRLGWIAMAALCLPGGAAAQWRFTAVATGAQEVPPVSSPAIAVAIIDVNAAETGMRDIVFAARLTNAIAAHIHCGPADAPGPVGATLYSGPAVTIPDSGLFDAGFVLQPDPGNACGWTTVSDIVSATLGDFAYVNIHTLSNPNGEIRGQLRAPAEIGEDCSPLNAVPGANLQDCDLNEAVISTPHLEGANLIRADFTFTLVDGGFMNNADARGADFSNADLFEAEFIQADLRYAVFRNTTWEFGYAPDANLAWADMEDAHLFFTVFDGASLFGANLKNADLTGSLNGTDLRNANLLGAALPASNLQGTVWGNTTCPDGSNSDDADGDGFTCLSNRQ